MANNKQWTWDDHKYKSRELVKGAWKYVYDTPKKVKEKASSIAQDTKNILNKSKEYISNKFENGKNEAKEIISNETKSLDNQNKDTSVKSTYTKTKERNGIVYSYKYTDLITDMIEDNPIPTSIVIGLSVLTGTSIGLSIGVTIHDMLVSVRNEVNDLKAYAQKKREKEWNDYQNKIYEEEANNRELRNQEKQELRDKYSEFIEENRQNTDEKFANVLTLDQFNSLNEDEKNQYKKDYPHEYMILMAKYDQRESEAINVSEEEADEIEAELNPGSWVEGILYDKRSAYDENCFACTLAYSEQRKGNDIYPDDELDDNGNKYTLYEKQIEDLYDSPNPIRFGYEKPVISDTNADEQAYKRVLYGKTYTESETKDIIDTMLYAYPEGSYGNMTVQWLDGGGHSMFWEIKDGEVIIRDAQWDFCYYQKDSMNSSRNYGLTDFKNVEDVIMAMTLCSVFRTDNISIKDSTKDYLKTNQKYNLSDAEYFKSLFE